MNRKDFIASIPLLSAIPFLSTRIERESNKIILLDPKPIEIVKEMPKMAYWQDFNLQLTWNGCVVAERPCADWTLSCDPVYEENYNYYRRVGNAGNRLSVRTDFNYDEVRRNIEKLYEPTNH